MPTVPSLRIIRRAGSLGLWSGRGRKPATVIPALLLVVLALLPLLPAQPLTPARLLTTMSLGLFAWLLVRFGDFATAAITVDFDGRRFRVGGRAIAFEDVRSLALGADDSAARDPGADRYAVFLVLQSGERITLLSGYDPARLVNDLRRIAPALDCPLDLGWGLPASAPLLYSPPAGRRASDRAAEPLAELPTALTLASGTVAEDRAIGRGVLGLTLGLAILMVLLGRVHFDGASPSAGFSIALPVAVVILVAWVAALLLTRQQRIALGTHLMVERRLLGMPIYRELRPRSEVLGLFRISPGGKGAEHVLILGKERSFSVPCPPSGATVV